MSNQIAIIKDTSPKKYDNPTFEQIVADLKSIANKAEQTGYPLVIKFEDWVSADTSTNLGFLRHYDNSMPSYHSHDYYELNICQKGSCTEYVDGKVIVLKERDILLMSPGISHTLYCDSDSLVFNLAIKKRYLENFDEKISSGNRKSYLSQFLKKDSFAVFENSKNTSVQTIVSSLNEYISNQNKTKTYKRIYLEAETNKILLELSEFRIKTSNISLVSNNTKEPVAERIAEYIYLNCSDISLEKLSEVFGYSSTHIYRIIKKYTGKSYAEFLSETRARKACKILETTDIPISEISSLVGFSTYTYFYKVFMKNIHITPTAYRKIKNRNS